MNNDTILLLKECDSGLKMAISSLDEVLDVIKNQKFKEICITSKNKHQTLKNEVDHLLKEHHLQEKEPRRSWAGRNAGKHRHTRNRLCPNQRAEPPKRPLAAQIWRRRQICPSSQAADGKSRPLRRQTQSLQCAKRRQSRCRPKSAGYGADFGQPKLL